LPRKRKARAKGKSAPLAGLCSKSPRPDEAEAKDVKLVNAVIYKLFTQKTQFRKNYGVSYTHAKGPPNPMHTINFLPPKTHTTHK
jgi:hypothetical protein